VSLRLAVLISGSGSTLRNILDRIATGRLPGVEMVGVAASRDCPGLQYARGQAVPYAVVPRGSADADFDAQDFSARLTAQLDAWQPDLIALAGFLSLYLVPPHYQHKVINVHPALLPAFGGPGMYGDRVHAAVLASGTKVTGCTVHFVSDEYDGGPIIAQRTVAVMDDDTPETLGARVREAERELYPTVIQWFAEGRVKVVGSDVLISQREL
jgi:phosphoribosylglycinamide formyltransferase-1